MATWDDMFGGLTGGAGGALKGFETLMMWLLIAVVVIAVVMIFVRWRWMKKRYNIPLIIITPRSDGRIVEINSGVGGYFKSRKVAGITSFRIKRKGIGIIEIPPPASTYLSAPNRTLIVAQKGLDDYEPVLPSSLNWVETPSGRKLPILQLKGKNQDATAWSFDNEESAKKRFTLYTFWDRYQTLITMMVFVFILFLILYINWMGMKDVVAGLQRVADALTGGGAGSVESG